MKASKELLQKRLYKRNQVLNANSPFVITDEILEHHYHAFQEPWGEGEKVILQKEDIMQYSKEESKAIWNQNAEFWDCAMGDPPAYVVARAAGRLENLYVQNGQEVEPDTNLGTIENTACASDVFS